MKGSFLILLAAQLLVAVGCGGSAWEPPSKQERSSAFSGCLRAQLDACDSSPIPLSSCIPFDWDSVLIADEAVVYSLLTYGFPGDEALSKAIRERPDLRVTALGLQAFIFLSRDAIVEVLDLDERAVDASTLVGAVLTPEEAVFTNRSPSGARQQPRLDPYFDPPDSLREEFLVWFVSHEILSQPRYDIFCVPKQAAPLLGDVRKALKGRSGEHDQPAVRLVSECPPLPSLMPMVPSTSREPSSARLHFSVNPVFFSATKVRMPYGWVMNPVAGMTAIGILVRTEAGWRFEHSYVERVP